MAPRKGPAPKTLQSVMKRKNVSKKKERKKNRNERCSWIVNVQSAVQDHLGTKGGGGGGEEKKGRRKKRGRKKRGRWKKKEQKKRK